MGAPTSRIVLEQAKRRLSVTHGVGLDEAFATPRRHAQDQRRDIHDVADEVVRSDGEFLALPSKSASALAELHRHLMRAANPSEELANAAAHRLPAGAKHLFEPVRVDRRHRGEM